MNLGFGLINIGLRKKSHLIFFVLLKPLFYLGNEDVDIIIAVIAVITPSVWISSFVRAHNVSSHTNHLTREIFWQQIMLAMKRPVGHKINWNGSDEAPVGKTMVFHRT